MTRVLYLTSGGEDYLSDGVLHGLKSLLGADVVDVPRRDPLYAGLDPAYRAQLYGRGFTLSDRLPDLEVDRDRPLLRARDGEFDLVVFGDIWQNWGWWTQFRPHARALRAGGTKLAALDGGDGPVMYPFGPSWFKQMRPWPLPRAHDRIDAYFKRELSPLTARVRYYGLLPSGLATRALRRHVRPLAFAIPEDALATGTEPKTQLLATHTVDPEVAALVDAGEAGKYHFTQEAEYYADMRAAKFCVTMRKAGWEALRHYEIAAQGCVPCFRDLDEKPALSAPFGLQDGVNCVVYTDARALMDRLNAMGDDEYATLRAGALAWARRNTTAERAREVLAAVGLSAG
jgi:hypothetical protein